jgi:hypothetical protein
VTVDRFQSIYIDPPSKDYYEDRLFDASDALLNRDDTLEPFIRLRSALAQQGYELHTADRLLEQKSQGVIADYYSCGIMDNFLSLKSRGNVVLRAFLIFEPPVVDPRLYRALPEITSVFERVYLHNTEGDGYSLKGVDRSRLRKLYWPQPRKEVLSEFWIRGNRLRRIVMINGNHKPASQKGELYSKRIEALVEFSRFGTIDLYGRGWEKWWSRNSMWMPYWKNLKILMSIYKGSCPSKYEVLSQYTFALCFENMSIKGYITEKLFDCLYAGTIPLYLGANDIEDLVPKNVYIDCRKFSTWNEIHNKIMRMSSNEIQIMRTAGKEFIQSKQGLDYYDSLISIFCQR